MAVITKLLLKSPLLNKQVH